VRSLLLEREIREDDLPAAFLLHGVESALAREFLRELRSALSAGDAEGPVLERFDPTQTPWRDILDVARTMPFFFSPWRLLVVDIEESEQQDLRAADSKMLAEYLAAPTGRTLLIVIVSGKARKASSLYKTFAAAPKSAVVIKLMEALEGEALSGWAKNILDGTGKRGSTEVIGRLIEVTGGDFQRLANEIDKLAAYVGDKKAIDIADVEALIAPVKENEDYALSNALEKGDVAEALKVMSIAFDEGAAPQFVLGQVGGFLKSILLAKSLLREGKDRREAFKEIRPGITERMGGFYQRRLAEFFAAVDALSARNLGRLIEELQAADLKIKTSDAAGRTLLESFVVYYGRMRKGRRSTSPGRG
jgi:DNA polymerase-3 subunit delta